MRTCLPGRLMPRREQELMISAGFRGTPGIVVREGDGSVKKFNGMPQGVQLAEVLGPR